MAATGEAAPLKKLSVGLREDICEALASLQVDGEQDADVAQRAVEGYVTYRLLSKAGTGKSYALSVDECDKACVALKRLLANGFSQDRSATICRALFADQSDEDMHEAFNTFDADRVGSIPTTELGRVLPVVGVDITPEQADELLAAAGADGTDKTEFREFSIVLRSLYPKESSSYFSVLSSYSTALGLGAAIGDLSSGVSHIRDAYNAGLSDLSAFELRKAGVLLENFDKAGHPREMAVTVCRAVLGDQTDGPMREAFGFFDKDGSGVIDKQEFKKALPLMGEDVSADTLQEVYSMADKNQSGTIDFEEFAVIVRAMNPKTEGKGQGDAEASTTASSEVSPAEAPQAEAARGAAPAEAGETTAADAVAHVASHAEVALESVGAKVSTIASYLPEWLGGGEAGADRTIQEEGAAESAAEAPQGREEMPAKEPSVKPQDSPTKPDEGPAEKPVEQPVDKAVEPPAAKAAEPPAAEKPAEPPAAKAAEPLAAEKPAEPPAEPPAEKAAEPPAEKLVEKPEEGLARNPSEKSKPEESV